MSTEYTVTEAAELLKQGKKIRHRWWCTGAYIYLAKDGIVYGSLNYVHSNSIYSFGLYSCYNGWTEYVEDEFSDYVEYP